jgi:hypothetical protein
VPVITLVVQIWTFGAFIGTAASNLPADALARTWLRAMCVRGAARRWFELGEEAAALRCCALGLFGRLLDA